MPKPSCSAPTYRVSLSLLDPPTRGRQRPCLTLPLLACLPLPARPRHPGCPFGVTVCTPSHLSPPALFLIFLLLWFVKLTPCFTHRSKMPTQEGPDMSGTLSVLPEAPGVMCVLSLVPGPRFRLWPFCAKMLLLFGMPVSARMKYSESVKVLVLFGFALLCFQGRIFPLEFPVGQKQTRLSAVSFTVPPTGVVLPKPPSANFQGEKAKLPPFP